MPINIFQFNGVTPAAANYVSVPGQDHRRLCADRRWLKDYTLRFGVTNLFDKDPPVLNQSVVPTLGATNGNTYSGAYDTLGRVLFFGFNAKL